MSLYIYILSLYLLYCSLHGGPPWTQGEAKRFQGQRPFWVVVPFLTTLYIPNHLAYWSGLEENRAPNTAISPGTKAEKATTPVVPSLTRIAGRCGSARGASGDPGPLSCLFFDPEKWSSSLALSPLSTLLKSTLRWAVIPIVHHFLKKALRRPMRVPTGATGSRSRPPSAALSARCNSMRRLPLLLRARLMMLSFPNISALCLILPGIRPADNAGTENAGGHIIRSFLPKVANQRNGN